MIDDVNEKKTGKYTPEMCRINFFSCRSLSLALCIEKKKKNQDKVDWLKKSRWKSKTTDRLNRTINSAIVTSNEDFLPSLSLAGSNRFFLCHSFSCLPIPLTCLSFLPTREQWRLTIRYIPSRDDASLTMDYFFSVLFLLELLLLE